MERKVIAMNKNMRIQKKYEVTIYDGREVVAKTMMASQVKTLKPESFDHFMSTCNGVLGYRAADGQWVEHRNTWPGMGPVGLAVLQALQLNPGDYLTPGDIAGLTGYESLRHNDVLAARVCAIRNAHSKNRMLVETRGSCGYALRWPKQRIWLWVDRIPASADNETER